MAPPSTVGGGELPSIELPGDCIETRISGRLYVPNDRPQIVPVGPCGPRTCAPLRQRGWVSPTASRAPWRPPEPHWCTVKSLPTPGGDNIGFMRNKWVELMSRGGIVACAEIAYNRNNSPSNFGAMCRARVMYEAAVEAIGKDVVAKSMVVEDATLRRAGLRPKLFPRRRPDAA
jgi:hypothetical protein